MTLTLFNQGQGHIVININIKKKIIKKKLLRGEGGGGVPHIGRRGVNFYIFYTCILHFALMITFKSSC